MICPRMKLGPYFSLYILTIYKINSKGNKYIRVPSHKTSWRKHGTDVSGCWHGNWRARAFLDDSKSQITLAEVTRESPQPVKASTQKRKQPQNERATYRMEKTVNALLQGFWISRIRTGTQTSQWQAPNNVSRMNHVCGHMFPHYTYMYNNTDHQENVAVE